ncbi:hypothetical protein KC19_VG105000 [Ceratodon purpureus]|uniref:Uncharacterized protein n=1 Tax=Ceratodon purpureus TaxID=3225 RepID=A0A8T0HNW3_CERPU|nr:hypothetical protein KC19_VG105000 [Ceratodon purpureus]
MTRRHAPKASSYNLLHKTLGSVALRGPSCQLECGPAVGCRRRSRMLLLIAECLKVLWSFHPLFQVGLLGHHSHCSWSCVLFGSCWLRLDRCSRPLLTRISLHVLFFFALLMQREVLQVGDAVDCKCRQRNPNRNNAKVRRATWDTVDTRQLTVPSTYPNALWGR